MGAPPSGLGTCDACRYYDAEGGWCRVAAPATHAAAPGGWPHVAVTDWCGRWESPTALPTDIALLPHTAGRNTGTVTVAVYTHTRGVFVSGDVVLFSSTEQVTTWVNADQLTFPVDTTVPVQGLYPVRVARPGTGQGTNVADFEIT
jgi:hypothetical protein